MPRTMELGKLVAELTATYLACNRDWTKFVSAVRNRPCLHHFIQNLPHPAANYLGHLRTTGAPIHCLTPDWTLNRHNDAAHRGSHQSARQYLVFSESEMADMIRKGYSVVLPYAAIKNLPNLRLSPMGVVPQRERRPRTIVDYSFSGINQEAAWGALAEAMQFGKALNRILQRILAANPRYGPTYMLKLRGYPNAGCGLPGGPWGGPARRAPTHTAHGLDGEPTLFLQRYRNRGGPHQPACLPFLGPTTASLGTGSRHPASTGWSALHHHPNTHVFATISTPGASTTPTGPATPSSSAISLW